MLYAGLRADSGGGVSDFSDWHRRRGWRRLRRKYRTQWTV